MSYTDYRRGAQEGYEEGKHHGLRLLEGERAHHQAEMEQIKEQITALTATNKGLQQSLDEATARINGFESAKKPSFKVGDKVKSKSNMAVRYYIVRHVGLDGTLNVQAHGGGMYYGQPADGFIPLDPAFKVGDRVHEKSVRSVHFTVVEIENGVMVLRGVESGYRYSGLRASHYELS